jgi:hypothetical protein
VSSRRIYTRKLLEQFPDDPKRGRFNARELIVPRFGQFVIQDWLNAVRLGYSDAVAEAWSEILFLAQKMTQTSPADCSTTRWCITGL